MVLLIMRFTPRRLKRLQGYSEKQKCKWDNNARSYVNGKPNDPYVADGGQIDKGFLVAKLINKHAFKTYPRLMSVVVLQLESQQTEDEINADITGGREVGHHYRRVIQTEENFGPAADLTSVVLS